VETKSVPVLRTSGASGSTSTALEMSQVSYIQVCTGVYSTAIILRWMSGMTHSRVLVTVLLLFLLSTCDMWHPPEMWSMCRESLLLQIKTRHPDMLKCEPEATHVRNRVFREVRQNQVSSRSFYMLLIPSGGAWPDLPRQFLSKILHPSFPSPC
jgi:hypothetical protein